MSPPAHRTRRSPCPDYAIAEQHRQDKHQDLVHQPPPQALAGDVGAEDLEVLAARGAQCHRDGFPDITGEERDCRVRC